MITYKLYKVSVLDGSLSFNGDVKLGQWKVTCFQFMPGMCRLVSGLDLNQHLLHWGWQFGPLSSGSSNSLIAASHWDRADLSKPTILFFTFVHAEKSKRTSPGGRHCRISATKFLLHVDFCISLALCSFMGKENQIITIFKCCLKCVLSIHCRKRTTQRPI